MRRGLTAALVLSGLLGSGSGLAADEQALGEAAALEGALQSAGDASKSEAALRLGQALEKLDLHWAASVFYLEAMAPTADPASAAEAATRLSALPMLPLLGADPMLEPLAALPRHSVSADSQPAVDLAAARWHAAHGDLTQAAARVASIPEDSAAYAESRYIAAVAATAEDRIDDAARAFARCLSALEQQGVRTERRASLAHLAHLGLARSAYARGQAREAAELYDRTDLERKLGARTLVEAAWAHLMAGNSRAALGRLLTALSPSMALEPGPEALELSALIFHSRCRWDEAWRATERALERYEPRLASFEQRTADARSTPWEETLARNGSPADGGASSDPAGPLRASSAFAALRRTIASLDGERGRISALKESGAPSSLIATLQSRLDRRRDGLGRHAAAVLAQSMTGQREELKASLRRITRLRIQILRTRRKAGTEEPLPSERTEEPRSTIRFEMNGEYWKDELQRYEVELPDRCGAATREQR